jgi:hypothetical protein
MSRCFSLVCGLCAVIVACAGTAGPVAQPPAHEPPTYMADGTILGVERSSPEDPVTHVHLVIQPTAGTPVRVDLGPGWYLDKHGLRFSKNEHVEVEGRRESRAGESVIVAGRVRKDGKTVEIVDQSP